MLTYGIHFSNGTDADLGSPGLREFPLFFLSVMRQWLKARRMRAMLVNCDADDKKIVASILE